jgi:CBS domain-containing protein
MFDLPIKSLMEANKLIRLEPQTMVDEAAKRMQSKNAGAVLVVDGTQLLGIFTERDAVFRVLAKGLDAKATPLRDVMTASPASLPAHSTYGHALLMMHDKGFRHVPVVEDGKVIGIITARNAMDPALEDFVSEERRREHYREEPV